MPQNQPQPQQPHQAQAAAAAGSSGFNPGQQANSSSYRLRTLHEVSENNWSQSGRSLVSGGSDKSDKSVHRAGVEALVKEGECVITMMNSILVVLHVLTFHHGSFNLRNITQP